MSIRVVADGADGYRLLSANNELAGWVRGRAIGVAGFADEGALMSAAIRSYRVLADWLEQQHLHPLPELGEEPARWIHDGAYRWLLVGRVPVARLPPGTPSGAAATAHAFEIVLKGSVSEGMTIQAALVALRVAHERIAAADVARSGRSNAFGARSSRAPTTHLELEAL
jgi:hypothetical protein